MTPSETLPKPKKSRDRIVSPGAVTKADEVSASAGSGQARPTLKTIAFMTGLGVTTVSKALKDAPDISDATKKRIRLVADQVGYRPNRAGVRLRTGKTNVISLILNTEEEILGLSSQMIGGISDALAGTSYHLVVTPYSFKSDPMAPVRYVVETGSADGVILSRIEPDDQRVQYLRDHKMPFVTHGQTDMGITHAFHDYDNTAFARDAVEKLHKLGRKRLALLGPPSRLTYAQHMRAGFLEAINKYDLHEVPLSNVTIESGIEQIAASICEFVSGPQAPDGLICGSGSAGIAAAIGLEQAGLELRREIDVISKQSSFDMLKWFRPGLHVISEDFREAGQDLTKKLLALLDGKDPATLQTLAYGGADRS
ncbi:MAG: LacI family DNA-binding transcriptional regulator [Rhodobacteraceae bacterium]|nr:LacI family DNA-binding transcriptional regulator [Paracoccaceae bacterium]